MTALVEIDVIDLFPGERAALLGLLDDLSDDDWAAPTACPGWSVRDVACHLLADDAGRLSGGRDGFRNPWFGAAGEDLGTFDGVVAAIDRQNAEWVTATKRLSPRLIVELLRFTGDATTAYFQRLDPLATGMAVDWIGPEPAPLWLDLAREYTERWTHQQHIRDAVGRPGLKDRRWFGPVLETFVRGVPRALAGAPAERGAVVRLAIDGDAGGSWSFRRHDRWMPEVRVCDEACACIVTLDQDDAWRIFTKGMPAAAARQRATIEGDRLLGERMLGTVSILSI